MRDREVCVFSYMCASMLGCILLCATAEKAYMCVGRTTRETRGKEGGGFGKKNNNLTNTVAAHKYKVMWIWKCHIERT